MVRVEVLDRRRHVLRRVAPNRPPRDDRRVAEAALEGAAARRDEQRGRGLGVEDRLAGVAVAARLVLGEAQGVVVDMPEEVEVVEELDRSFLDHLSRLVAMDEARDRLPRIFLRFERVEESRQRPFRLAGEREVRVPLLHFEGAVRRGVRSADDDLRFRQNLPHRRGACAHRSCVGGPERNPHDIGGDVAQERGETLGVGGHPVEGAVGEDRFVLRLAETRLEVPEPQREQLGDLEGLGVVGPEEQDAHDG